MKCKHAWEKIDKTILTHPIADAIRGGMCYEGASIGAIKDRVIYVFQCKLCSKIKIEER